MLTYERYYSAKLRKAKELELETPPKKFPDHYVRVCFAQQGADRDATSTHEWVEFTPEPHIEWYTEYVYPVGDVRTPVVRRPLR